LITFASKFFLKGLHHFLVHSVSSIEKKVSFLPVYKKINN